MVPDELLSESNDLSTYLKATIQELRNNNTVLTRLATQQQRITEKICQEITICNERITDLELRVDELQQDKLSNQVLMSGPDITALISSLPEQRENMRNLGFHSLGKLRSAVALKTVDHEKLVTDHISDVITQAINSGQERPKENEIHPPDITSDHPDVKSLIAEQGIESAFILSDTRIAVHTTTRKATMAILTRGKRTNRAIYFSEQLTRHRQGIMYKLRQFRDAHPRLRLSVFSRNGVPAVRVGTGRHTFIRNEDDVRDFAELLGRRRTPHNVD